ncbi:MAG: TPM domain-containing protein [Solobacterium sp.]|nr:TPM domain-containing protein [Solobacterium sp.]
MRTGRWLSFLAAALALLAVLFFPVKTEAANAYIIDETGQFTSQELLELNQIAEEISLRQKCGVYVIVTKDMHGYRESNFAQGLFMNYDLGYGEGEGASGVLLAVSLENAYFDCTAYGAAAKTFDSRRLQNLNDIVYSHLANRDWTGAVKAYLKQCDSDLTSTGYTYYVPQYTDPAINTTTVTTSPAERRSKWLSYLPFEFIGSGLISSLFVGLMKSKNKNVKVAVTADQYVINNGVKLNVSLDQFTGKTRSITRIPRDNGGGGGGGGGGSHTYHSSGFSSSGGGRHF